MQLFLTQDVPINSALTHFYVERLGYITCVLKCRKYLMTCLRISLTGSLAYYFSNILPINHRDIKCNFIQRNFLMNTFLLFILHSTIISLNERRKRTLISSAVLSKNELQITAQRISRYERSTENFLVTQPDSLEVPQKKNTITQLPSYK